MSFIRANIDRAIVMTQYDLRGFGHPLGFRQEPKNSKSFDATTGNFMACAAGCGRDRVPTDDNYADYFESTYEEYLAMCKRLVKCCDMSEKEAIQLIIKEILKQSEEMKAEVVAGTRQPSPYLKPLEKENRWGKAVIALAEAFEVPLKAEVAA